MHAWASLLLSVLGCCGAGLVFAAPCPQPLRIGYLDVDSPPMLRGQGQAFADPPGWQVLAMREAARKLGCSVQEQRLPGLRLDLLLEQGDVDFSLFYGVTPERLRLLRYPLDAAGRPDRAWAPLMGSLALYALVGSPQARPGVAWDGQRLGAGVRVGVVQQTTQESLARARGWALEHTLSIDNGLQMLRAGRFEVLLSTRETMRPNWLGGEGGLVELSPLVDRVPYFVVASRRVWQLHPEFTQAFWRESCRAVRQLAPEARPVDCGLPMKP